MLALQWVEDVKQKTKGRIIYNNRKEDSIITCIWIWHSTLNYSLFIIGKHETEQSNSCGQAERIGHGLKNCTVLKKK